MSLNNVLPVVAGIVFVVFAVYTMVAGREGRRNLWLFPAGLSAVFLAFSVRAVVVDGPFGFWPEHTRNLWGNQIWFDLLLAVGIGWFLIVPQARAVGMRLPLWLVLIVSTGCIGFLAMLARLLYLRERGAGRSRGDSGA